MHKQRNAGALVFILSCLTALSAQAGGKVPAAGLYENSSSTPILPLLASAQRAIDIEIYTMNDPVVQKMILAAQNGGIKVRIIQEPQPIGSSCNIFVAGSAPADAGCDSLKAFRAQVIKNGGVYVPFNHALCGHATKGCVEHGKMVIVDAKAALLSTGNLDASSVCDLPAHPANCDRDYAYIIHYTPAIQTLGQIFERDLAGAPYDLQPLLSTAGARDLTVSPFSLKPLVDFINSSKKSLVIQEQYLNDPEMNAAILAAAKAGVAVTINVESICGFGKPSTYAAQNWTNTYTAFEQAGAKIRIFTKNIRVKTAPGYLHAKAIIVDGKTAWMGSINGSTEAIGSNREFGVFFDAPADVNYLTRFIAADFNNPAGETWQQSLTCANDYATVGDPD